ncbi:T-box [Ancylostoma caninum]|uniref:T-box n=1 Tax=Ancylostoma caninum TaxID=29170 RepID=A0A368H6J4_ANCCA|nr:T-box [Ancylostoma caninum]
MIVRTVFQMCIEALAHVLAMAANVEEKRLTLATRRSPINYRTHRRRMFPVLSISINGLEPSANYSLMVDMECVDSKRYRYSFHQSKWTATGPGTYNHILLGILEAVLRIMNFLNGLIIHYFREIEQVNFDFTEKANA